MQDLENNIHIYQPSIMKKILLFTFGIVLLIMACESQDQSAEINQASMEVNPAAEGFNMQGSDSQAVAIADSVMAAMGGRQSWDQANVIQWNFFGRRTHTWNKQTGRDSIHIPGQNLTIDMNIESQEGSVYKNGAELTQPDSVQKYLQQGYEMWVNDSYWLLMPYKLKDSGVTLAYLGMDTTATGIPAHKLKVTFDEVGVTPQNMYHVYVDTAEYLVRQWAYYSESTMDEPGFVLPWNNYQQYGDILLSGDRGRFQLSDIEVMDEWPDGE